MSRIIRNTHISGEAGVLKFSEHCNRHVPYIIFREVVKNDFGVDLYKNARKKFILQAFD